MKKAFILLMSLVALVAANISTNAQKMAEAEAFMGSDALRSQISFDTDGNWNDGSKWSTG